MLVLRRAPGLQRVLSASAGAGPRVGREGTAHLAHVAARRTAAVRAASTGRGIVGCGSNVVDRFFKVKALPKPGEKGFFASPTRILEDSIVGGVTLNHLSWAAQLRVPVALMALQGDDPSGKLIRQAMKQLGVSAEHVGVSEDYTTAESYVLLQPDGERSIIMASGATSLIDSEVVKSRFAQAISKAALMSTEISQVPLSGVLQLLSEARAHGVLSVLDVDVSPSVAVNEACLGSLEQVWESVMQADVLKPAKHAAEELLAVLDSSLAGKVADMDAIELASRLRELSGSKLVALTSGSQGCTFATETLQITVPPFKIPTVVDATGAGDAFLGGMLAGLIHRGGEIPQTEQELRDLAVLANATGAACCEVLGALPNTSAWDRVAEMLGQENNPFLPLLAQTSGGAENDSGAESRLLASLATDYSALQSVLEQMDLSRVEPFISALATCEGRVLVSGLGKSGVVARRMAASLASTGTPAHFVHAAEWVHGDLGSTRDGQDVVVLFSHSGNTAECVAVVEHLKARNLKVLAVVGSASSQLAKLADSSLVYSLDASLEPLGGAPTCSVVIQEALVNAVVAELISRRGFSRQDFGRNHPGGSIGAAFATAQD